MTWGAAKAETVRLITLTQVPEDWQRARWQVRDLIRRVRKAYAMEMAWAIERNPAGTGYHAHGIQHGEYIAKKRLQELWGGRIVDLRKIEKGAEGYVTKCASVAGYLTKDAVEHLQINGMRPVHFTRGYLHGRTSRDVLREMSTQKKWHLEHPTKEEIGRSRSGEREVAEKG
jgi:hypothetical protein